MFSIKKMNLVSERRLLLPSNQECPICWNSIHSTSNINQSKGLTCKIIVTSCGHSFHEDCVNSWIKRNKTCPLCSNNWSISMKLDCISKSIENNKPEFENKSIQV